jgi:hypothetical protein
MLVVLVVMVGCECKEVMWCNSLGGDVAPV